MDFSSLLDSAASNAKHVSKTLNNIESEVDKARKEKLRKLELERQRKHHEAKRKRRELEEAKQRKEEEDRKKFTIPKKKNDGVTVDKAGIEAYKAKKEQEARDKLKKAMAEKERLIQLRMQNFGGKANKKIGKHFGLNPIDLQIRYGNDHEHVERLQKQKLREEEELDERAAALRTGVYKAKEMQRKTEEKLRQSGTPKQPHRVSTSKSNSLAGLSSRHTSTRDHFSPPPEPKAKAPKPAYKPPEKKRPAAPPVDFSSLLRAAEDISQGKKVSLSSLHTPKPDVKEGRREPSSQSFNKHSSEKSRHDRDRDASQMSRPSSNSSQPVRPNKPSVAPSKPTSHMKQDKNDNKVASTEKAVRKDGRFVKKPTPPPIIPAAVPGKKYLPGDVRYQSSLGSSSASTSKQVAPSRPSSSSNQMQSSRQDKTKGSGNIQRSKEKPQSSRGFERAERPREPSRVDRERERNIERERERDREKDRRRIEEKQREKERIRRMNEKRKYEESLPLRERERMRDLKRRYGDHHDENDEDDEDDYDSDMDDFIDDTGLDEDDLYKQELEDTLKQVNPKYNKQLWKQRERQIDDRHMDARYDDIQREEKRSARIGLLEDLKEAQTGKSIALG